MKNIGTELYNIIKDRRLKQMDVAELLGMTPVNLSKIFKKSTIDAKLLEKISKKLNIPITYFFDSEQIVDVLEDPEEKYIDDKKKCPNCIQLQKFIDSLERHIKRLELDLEECRGDTGKQKQAS